MYIYIYIYRLNPVTYKNLMDSASGFSDSANMLLKKAER